MPGSRHARGFTSDVVVVGGCGRVGLPLAAALACRGTRVAVYDVAEQAVAAVSAGRMPFAEPGTGVALERVIASGQLVASADPRIVSGAEHVIVAMPPDDYTWESSGPERDRPRARRLRRIPAGRPDPHRAQQVCPGSTAQLEKMVAERGLDVDVAFCPERVAEGRAMTEFGGVPQIVSSRTSRGLERAGRLLSRC